MTPRKTLAIGLLTLSSSALAANPPSATQDNFNRSVTKYLKGLNERIVDLEKKLAREKSLNAKKKEESIDLSSLDAKPEAAAASSAPYKKGTHAASSVAPNFRVFFDLNLISRPRMSVLSFQNFHAFLLYEIVPNEKLQFSFDVNPFPRYYELAYQATPSLQLRAGMIWIPFDDLAPHNIFGGRVNTSRLSPVSGAVSGVFLPDLWTDLGVGLKYTLMDTSALAIETHAYVVNGFREGGTDPAGVSSSYPTFTDANIAARDNNRNKALGGRVQAKFSDGMLSLGASYYKCTWSNDDQYGLTAMGGDSRLRLDATGTEIRAGFAAMNVDIPGDSFSRGGFYGEVGQKFGAKRLWKLLLRGGELQLDSRRVDVTDQAIVGATVLFQPGPIQYSIEHSRDLKQVPNRVSDVFSSVRLVIAL